jgi:hypothetical protein
MEETKIKCPNCGTQIDVNDVLYHQLDEGIRKVYEDKNAQTEKDFRDARNEIRLEKEKLASEKADQDVLIKAQVSDVLKVKKIELEKTIREEVASEKSEELNLLNKELDLKNAKLKEHNKIQAENEKLKRDIAGQREEIELEKEKEFTERLKQLKIEAESKSDEKYLFQIKELERKLEDQKALTEEMQRKQDQGSMQLQGDVQQKELENILRELWPQDDIRPIKPGKPGADVLQVVKNSQGTECGKIYYESKRTKHFDNGWLQKLRDDNLQIKADSLVIATEVMPDGADKYFFKDDVWVCHFWEIKLLSLVLRHALFQVHSVAVTQQGKETKMEMLYNYLISQEFKGQFGAIMEGFKAIQENHYNEKIRTQKIWKERETQLDKVMANASEFYGKLKGIAGASLPDIKMLESGSLEISDAKL